MDEIGEKVAFNLKSRLNVGTRTRPVEKLGVERVNVERVTVERSIVERLQLKHSLLRDAS